MIHLCTGRLEELLPAAAWSALEGDIAELQRAADDDMFAEDLRASGMVIARAVICLSQLH